MSAAGQGDSPSTAPLARALAATRLAQTEPARAQRMAAAAAASAPTDTEVSAVAARALGIAAATRGDLGGAADHLVASAEIADLADLPARVAEARGTLAYLRLLMGRSDLALEELERAAATSPTGLAAARLHMQRGLVFEELQRLDEAATSLDLAVSTLRSAGGDDLLEADTRTNRAIVRTGLADWEGASHDLQLAEALYVQLGHVGRTAMVHHNRGNLEMRRGDLPAALTAFDLAVDRYRAAGMHPGLASVERAEALLAAGLGAEARRAAAAAVADFRDQRNSVDQVQARIVLAEAALLEGDFATAQHESRAAGRAAARQGRPHWSALANHLSLRARWLAGQRGRAMLAAARRAAAELDAAGWIVPAVDARLIAAGAALDLGLRDEAEQELALVGRARTSGPAELRARAWYAEAILRRSKGDRVGAAAAVRSGLRILEQFQAGLGATDMRAHAATHAAELGRLGVRLAIETGRARSVLAAAERNRAGALRVRPVRAPDDVGLVADLAELRRVIQALRSGAADTPSLLVRRTAIEDAIRDRARHAVGSSAVVGAVTPAQLSAALDQSTLIEYLDLDGEIHAVIATGGRMALRTIGRSTDVERMIGALRAGLQWLAYASDNPRSLPAVLGLVERSAAELDAMLFGAFGLGLDHAPLVLVPTGPLHALPWSALASCARRPVSIAPSAALWCRAATNRPTTTGTAVIAYGPDLQHAAKEVAAVARQYHQPVRLGGRRAGVSQVLAALDGAGIAHLAAHGTFRTDNPMFSELLFADGPLTIYDLERLVDPPVDIVLAACDSGRSQVHSGDELVGLAAALLGLGTTSLIAAMVPVPDAASRTLMVQFHRRLVAGRSPAAALADARQLTTGPGCSPAAIAAAAGFLCLGAG